MKEKILNIVKEHPGCRLSTLASLAHESKTSVMKVLYDLEDESKVFRKLHSEPANMEYYYQWYASVEEV